MTTFEEQFAIVKETRPDVPLVGQIKIALQNLTQINESEQYKQEKERASSPWVRMTNANDV